MPDDVAAQAIVSVIGGERKWDPERGPLLRFLKRVVDSLLNHLAESVETRRTERFSPDDEPFGPELITFGDSGAGPWQAISGNFNAAGSAEPYRDADRRVQRLLEAATGTPELAEVLNAILDFDEARPRLIALRLGKPVRHINNCLKRLRRMALKIETGPETEAASRGVIHP